MSDDTDRPSVWAQQITRKEFGPEPRAGTPAWHGWMRMAAFADRIRIQFDDNVRAACVQRCLRYAEEHRQGGGTLELCDPIEEQAVGMEKCAKELGDG